MRTFRRMGLPASAGVTASAVADTVVAPYNVVPALDDTYAAVIVEPCAANMGLVAPVDGFLEGTIELEIDGEVFALARGDAVTFGATVPHTTRSGRSPSFSLAHMA